MNDRSSALLSREVININWLDLSPEQPDLDVDGQEWTYQRPRIPSDAPSISSIPSMVTTSYPSTPSSSSSTRLPPTPPLVTNPKLLAQKSILARSPSTSTKTSSQSKSKTVKFVELPTIYSAIQRESDYFEEYEPDHAYSYEQNSHQFGSRFTEMEVVEVEIVDDTTYEGIAETETIRAPPPPLPALKPKPKPFVLAPAPPSRKPKSKPFRIAWPLLPSISWTRKVKLSPAPPPSSKAGLVISNPYSLSQRQRLSSPPVLGSRPQTSTAPMFSDSASIRSTQSLKLKRTASGSWAPARGSSSWSKGSFSPPSSAGFGMGGSFGRSWRMRGEKSMESLRSTQSENDLRIPVGIGGGSRLRAFFDRVAQVVSQ